MPRPLRVDFPGALLHVYARGNNRRRTFLDDRDRRLFLRLLGEAVETFGWILYAYALMPNHYHLFLQLTEATFSKGFHWLDGKYAQAFNKRHNRVGHVFQDRPKAPLVQKETYFLNLLRYIILNPVRARIVSQPEEYEWSSYRATAGYVEAPNWLAVDDALSEFAPQRDVAQAYYRDFVRAGIGSSERPLDNLVAQTYLGCKAWCEEMQQKLESKPNSDMHLRERRTIGRPTIDEVISTVGSALRVGADEIRCGRGGAARMLTGWIAKNEALLKLREIAPVLGLGTTGTATLIERCQRELDTNPALREHLDQCISSLRRAKT